MTYDADYHAGESVGQLVGFDQEEVGDWRNGEIALRATGEVQPHMRGPGGGIRTGALASLCDNACGFTGGLASLPDGWVVSTNLALRRYEIATVGPLRIEVETLRRGRSAVVTAGAVYDDGAAGGLVADAVLTSAVLVPDGGPPTWERPARIVAHQLAGPPDLVEAFGIRAPDGDADDSWLDVRDQLRNPWGFVHGGVTATLVDVAAERAVRRASDGAATMTTDLTMHYLAPARHGPLRARPRVIGTRADAAVCRIDVVDEGHDQRHCVMATATVRSLR